jgi:[NiFe] hydrogenase assembly HybE family chaperone
VSAGGAGPAVTVQRLAATVDAPPALGPRVRALEALFEQVAATRMHGVPILHPQLSVRAVGFEAESDGRHAVGVLVTPWFMNLVRLPLTADGAEAPLRTGEKRTRRVGHEHFDFIGGHEPGFGPYEACSLFSPMLDFVDQAAALATAEEVLRLLRAPQADAGLQEALPPGLPTVAPAATPSRRALLFGRGAGGAR